MSYYEPNAILRWTATKGRNDTVQNTSDIDGRVRFVQFILGEESRDTFLKKMRVQLKLQRTATPPRPVKKPATKRGSKYDSVLWQSRIKNCTEDGALHLTRCATKYDTSKGGLWAYAKRHRIRTANHSEVNAAERQ
jgi:hypothetical protein